MPVPTGIVSWWPGEGTAQDFGGNNRGTLQGGFSFVPGMVALTFNFDGSTGYVNVPDSSSLHSIARTVSVEMWAKPEAIAAGTLAYMYSRRNPLTSENFSIYTLADGTFGVLLRSTTNTGSKFESSPAVVTFGTMQNIAATANTNTSAVRAYVNGTLIPLTNVFGSSSFGGTFSSVQHLYIGRRQDPSIEVWAELPTTKENWKRLASMELS